MQTERIVMPCLACGGSDLRILQRPEEIEEESRWLWDFHRKRVKGPDEDLKDKAEFTQSEPTFVMRCETCGTLLRNPQPTPESLRRRYRHDEYGTEALIELLEGERAFFRAKAAAIDLRPGARVLEVGSFVGAFLIAAEERGWDATGVDIGQETCAFMEGIGLNIRKGDLASLPFEERFDAVFVWNTFDQINEPEPLLLRIKELLRPGGTLIVRVPNGIFKERCLATDDERCRLLQAYNNFLSFPYLCGYTPASLQGLLERCGFRVAGVEGDVIVPLAGPLTKPFAVEEEAGAKRLVLRYCRMQLAVSGRFLYPWMDFHVRST